MTEKIDIDAELARIRSNRLARQGKANGRDATSDKAPGDGGLVVHRAADIKPEPVEWLWPGRLARGKHTCFAGEPGTGKSQLSISIVASVTTGGDWPCDEGRSPLGSVIVLSAEDGAADTIIPRLMAAGADLERVHIVSAVCEPNGGGRRSVSLQSDLDLIERKVTDIGDVALIVIDPVSSYLGKADSHKNAEVRGVLEPISEMAERLRVAVLTITHFSKAGANSTTKALHRFIGSIAFTGAPRAAFAVIEDVDNEGRRLFLPVKNNLAAPPQGLAFRLEQRIVGDSGKGIVASSIAWDSAPVTITAAQALAAEAATGEHRSARAEAEEFLTDLLASGPVPQQQVKDAAEGAGIAWATVRRAKDRLRIKPHKAGMDTGWTWELDRSAGAKVLKFPEGAHIKTLSTFGPNEHLREAALTPEASHGESVAASARVLIREIRLNPSCDHCHGEEAPGNPLLEVFIGSFEFRLHQTCIEQVNPDDILKSVH